LSSSSVMLAPYQIPGTPCSFAATGHGA
jgi:hypothetical protein